MTIGFAGKFIIHKQKVLMADGIPALDSDGNQILLGDPIKVAEFDNLITDGGLNRIGINGRVADVIYLSSDNSTPKFSDTTLAGLLGGSDSTITNSIGDSSVDTSPYFVSNRTVKRFLAGVGTGNIAKIGVGWGSVDTISGLWSVALVKDAVGANTIITKLADEILDVTYEVRTYLPSTDYTGVINISDVPHNVKVRVSLLSASWAGTNLNPTALLSSAILYAEGVGTVKGLPSGSQVDVAISKKAYIDGSYENRYTIQASVSQANFPNGIKGLIVQGAQNNNYWQAEFSRVSDSKGIMKTSEFSLIMPDFVVSWGRYVAP